MQIEPQVWKVYREIKKYLQPEEAYVLAVSGGADSLALADAALAVFADRKEQLLICHIEHGIRGEEALNDAELVKAFCESRDAAFVCCHVDVPAQARAEGISLEDAARKLRYAQLREQCLAFNAAAIVTAHQADDQAETVLWKLLRGAGSDGISGMKAVVVQDKLKIIRPLLELKRTDLEAYCASKGLKYCQDSTNDDVQYTRNKIRKVLFPYLEKEFNPSIKDTLVREAKLIAEEQEFINSITEKYLQDKSFCGIVDMEKQGVAWRLSVKKWIVLPPVLRKRILRGGCFALGSKELSYERTLALEKLCLAGVGGKLLQLGGDLEAIYRNNELIIYRGGKNHA